MQLIKLLNKRGIIIHVETVKDNFEYHYKRLETYGARLGATEMRIQTINNPQQL